MALKLANKTMSVLRLSGGSYQPHLTDVKMRYEGITDDDSTNDLDKNRVKGFHLAYNMMVDKIDLKVSDRCVVTGDNKTFVVCGLSTYDDVRLAHHEVLIREIDSDLHEDIQLRTLGTTQPNYDPIFKQWAASKFYQDSSVKALVDDVKPGMYADLQAAGKLENVKFVVTLELPAEVNLNEKVVIRGQEYNIEEILDFPYQKQILVSKVLPSGTQFS